MNINIVKTTGAVYNAEQNKPKLGEKLGKEDFLKLLVTQLRYQDPIKPMSNEQFIAQTAEFSSLEQMQEMNSNIRAFIESQRKISKSSAISLIGRNVTVNKSAFSLSSDKASASLTYNLPKDADVTITIFDSLNKVIRTVDLGRQRAGTHSYLWDGKTNQNNHAGKGDYSYKITAKDADGKYVTTDNMISGQVEGISFEGDDLLLNIAGASYPLSALAKVLPSNVEV